MRELEEVTREYVIDHCGINGGVQSYQTLTGARALDFLEAVGLGLIADWVTMLAKAARRERGPHRVQDVGNVTGSRGGAALDTVAV